MKNINDGRIKILTGYNKDEKTIFFLEIENTRYFSVCACVGRLINCDTYTRDDLESCLDDCDLIYDIMKRCNLRSIDDVLDVVIDEAGGIYRAICDCSCTDYEIYNNGDTYNFETESCGQCVDQIDNFILYNKDLKFIFKCWNEYHLKQAPRQVTDRINRIINRNIALIDNIDAVLVKTFFTE